jgi:hypothetical protein
MTQMEQDMPISQVDDQEIVQTAPLREFVCEPSGCGLIDEVGVEITRYVAGLRNPLCLHREGLSSRAPVSPAIAFFE